MQSTADSSQKWAQSVLWSRDKIAGRILAGESIVIYRNYVLRITPNWLNVHPGGALAILHYVGRDATDEIDAFHADHTLERVKGFIVGRVETGEDGWSPLVPPVASGWVRSRSNGDERWTRSAKEKKASDPSSIGNLTFSEHNRAVSEILLVRKEAHPSGLVEPSISTITPPPSTLSQSLQARHARAYRDLHAKVAAAGLYKTPYLTGYGPEFVRYFVLGTVTYNLYIRGWIILSAFFLGLFWHQVTFAAHDLGHMGVTHNWVWDRIMGIAIADFIGGLSIGWWVDNHNIHHLVPNHPTHDPDIQHIPFFAISPVFLNSLYSSYYDRIMTFDKASRFFLSMQHKLYYFVMSLARFNLYTNSYAFLWKRGIVQGKRGWPWWGEIVGITIYWTWYIQLVRGCGDWKQSLGFILVSHMTASPLHVQIVLSHFSRSTADLGPSESFAARQLRTTSDVICDPSIEFIHGGLNLQVTHHLFPRLPRHNLRAASLLVKEFAREQGLEYAEFRFIEGNKEVLGVLKGVAEQVQILGMVAEHEIKEKVGM